jgi:cell division septation protein DedD
MRDDHASEEKLMKELDRMYLRVADLESGQGAAQNNPDERDHNSNQRASTHEKVIPFPASRIHVLSGEPTEDQRRRKRKPWYRSYLIISLSVIFLLVISLLILSKLIIARRDAERAETHQITVPIPLERSAPVQTEDAGRGIEKREQRAELQPDQITKPVLSLTQKRHYTVQVGAFRNRGNTRDLIGALQKKGLKGYWVEINTKDGGTWYRAFCGYFMKRNEAAEFMRDKGILKDYPGSFVCEISSNEGEPDLPSGANREE